MQSWLQRTTDFDIEKMLSVLLVTGKLTGADSLILYDQKSLENRFQELALAFPARTLHAVAVKANPLVKVLRQLVTLGAGLEVASAGEIALALAAECQPQNIVFDSPAKTTEELSYALEQGIRINANSLSELARIDKLLDKNSSSSLLGLRVNPVVIEAKRESATMVATSRSKFGLPALEVRQALEQFPWLSGLHLHVGSQLATKDDMALGVARTLEIAQCYPAISWVDIGGGLPTRYRATDPGLAPKSYVDTLKAKTPKLFDYHLVTEVGRSLHSGCGWAVSKVEYADKMKAIIHLGADFALRPCYHPEIWQHEITVYNSNGQLKKGERKSIDIFGPLCFSGDRLAANRELPPIKAGDLVVIHDIGAYTFSMWSRYCSRPMPEIIGYQGESWQTLRRAESPGDLVNFWSS